MRIETMINILTILLMVGGLPSLMTYRCLTYPVQYLENGCAIRNLTVRDSYSNLLTEDRLCDTTIYLSSHTLNWPYQINFTDVVGQQYRRSTFLLIVLDNTTKKLLWMVANISVYDRRLTPLSGFHNRPYTFKPYEKPVFNATHRQHQIEFLVLQQDLNFPQYAHFIQQSNYCFNLLQWLNEQTSAGARFCGPVAGAMVRIYDNSHHPPDVYQNTYPPYPANQNGGTRYPTLSPPFSSPPHSSHHKNGDKNTAFCINSNIGLLGAVVGVTIYRCRRHQRLYQ